MRRHELDWLRVIVFGLLIFYHVGMFFVPWDYHIKNNTIYHWLTYPMWFLNQWRLPILFIISGMGTFYALRKRTGKQFAWERLKRLSIPLIVGMIFIVPPQVYVERLVNAQFTGHYFDFWPVHALRGSYPVGNFSWHHLWFLPYLLLFSLFLIPLFLYFKNHPNNGFNSWLKPLVKSPLGIYVFIIPLYFIEAFIEPFFPVTHALIDDWFTIINCITLFTYGFLIIAVNDTFWLTVEKYRGYFLVAGIMSFTIMLFLTHKYEESHTRHLTAAFFKVLNLWSWILAIFGFAAKYLNTESKALSYSNEAVYPFYILHQSVMLVIAYYLIDLDWSLGSKAGIMVLGTFGISWLFYECLIRRWKCIRPLFGLKKKALKGNN